MIAWCQPFLLGFVALTLLAGMARAQPVVPTLPRTDPLSPGAALQAFSIREGFAIDCIAHEPEVVDPIAFSFDEWERMYVVEMRDYSERRDERLGRVRLLVDRDRDGVYEQSTVFAEGLAWPTGVLCWDGGVFVIATPDILFLKDTSGDGVSDHQEIVFTGLGEGVSRLNVQQLANSLQWGPDHRVYGASGGNGGRLRQPGKENSAVDLRYRDFSFDPRDRSLRAEFGGGQYGMSFDSFGRRFTCSNSRHAQMYLFELPREGLSRNLGGLNPLWDIALEGPAAEVFRKSPDEAWRQVRTRWRVSGQVPGMIEGGGRVSGYFTAATGITIYRGGQWGPAFAEDLLVADAGSNLIHHKKTYDGDVPILAQRPGEEQTSEFLASTDNWFRPVQLGNGPGGYLYIADMYREIIEHPWSLPEPLKQHLDLNRGNDKGRIYRVRALHRPVPREKQPGSMSIKERVAALASPNSWTMETAARLLLDEKSPALRKNLESVLQKNPRARARLAALNLLRARGELHDTTIHRALKDADPGVRFWAVRALGEGTLALRLLQDVSPWVRLEAVQAMPAGEAHAKAVLYSLPDLLNPVLGPAWLAHIQDHEAPEILRQWARGWQGAGGEGYAVLERLAEKASRSGVSSTAMQELLSLYRAGGPQWAIAIGWGKGGAMAGMNLSNMVHQAFLEIQEQKLPEQEAMLALRVLSMQSSPEIRKFLETMPGSPFPVSWQLMAVQQLRPRDPIEPWFVSFSRTAGPVRSALLDRTLQLPQGPEALARLIDRGSLRPADFSPIQKQRFQKWAEQHQKSDLVRMFQTTLPQEGAEERRLQSAFNLPGDRERGRTLFVNQCSACHERGGQGVAVGPDLVSALGGGKEKLLLSIVQPNAEVPPAFGSVTVETPQGESWAGVLANETSDGLSIKVPQQGLRFIPRAQVKSVTRSELSLMPEGLTATWTPQDVADLFEFLLVGPGL